MTKKLASVYEAAEVAGNSPWTWRRWAREGKVASHKIGARLMIPMSEIDRVISESERPRLEVAK